MAINWNREITGKDVKKFFNQEIKLGEINYSKCMQVSLLIFALGIVPAFTYGMVLGVLDEQRVALMGEVSSLKAQVISSTSSIPRSSMIYSAATDKTVYILGATTTVSFYNSYPASTTNIFSIDLYASSTLVQRIMTMSPYQGPNKISFKVATSSLEKANTFHVRVTAIKFGQYADTNRFVVQKYAMDTRPVVVDFVSSSAYKSFSADADGEKDIGTFVISYKVTAGVDNDIYLRRKGIAWATTTDSTTGKVILATLNAKDSSAKDTQDSYFIPKGFTRSFVTQVDLQATKSGYAGVTIKSIEWATTSPSAYPNKTVMVDSNVFKTDVLSLYSLAKPEPSMVVTKMNAVPMSGYGEGPIVSDLGVYRFLIRVVPAESDMYIPKKSGQYVSGDATKGLVFSHSGGQSENSWSVSVVSDRPALVPEDTATHFFIKKGTVRSFNAVVSLAPRGNASTKHGFTFKGLNWGTSANAISQFAATDVVGPTIILGDR